MTNGQSDLRTIIIVGVIAVIGAILFAVGSATHRLRLRYLGIAVLMGAGLFLFVVSAVLREVLTAFAALVAVIIAAVSINESRRIRQDTIERESRDRRERLLSEITKWLRELHAGIFTGLGGRGSLARDLATAHSEAEVEKLIHLYTLDLAYANVENLVSSISQAQYHQKLASKLDERLGGSLQAILEALDIRLRLAREEAERPHDSDTERKMSEPADKKTAELMDKLIEDALSPLEGVNLSEEAVRTIRLGRNALAIRAAIFTAIDRAIELEIDLTQVS